MFIKKEAKYQNLLVSGCSFTYNKDTGGPYAWPNVLASWYDLTLHNLAIPGAGNTHISHSVQFYLEQHRELTPDNTLILVMWSGPGRIDWMTDKSLSNFCDIYPATHEYVPGCELVCGGHWWNIKRPTHLFQTLIEYSKYQSESSFAAHTWMAMNSLSNYLTVRNFDYYYTSFLDLSKPVMHDAQRSDLFTDLSQLKLDFDFSRWISNERDEYLGEFARKRKLLNDDKFHPSMEGHELWLTDVLIPKLQNKNILGTLDKRVN